MGNYGKKVFFMGFIEQERHIDLLACAIFVKIRRKMAQIVTLRPSTTTCSGVIISHIFPIKSQPFEKHMRTY